MRMRPFTHRQPPADIRVKPQEYKVDPEVSLNHDDFYARAWEYDYEQPIFEAENNNTAPPNSQEIPAQSEFSTEEVRNTPGTTHHCSPESFPQTNEVSDVTDTYPHMEPDMETSSEQPENSPTNPRSSKYNLRHNPKPNCNEDRLQILTCPLNKCVPRNAHVDVPENSRNALRGTYAEAQMFSHTLFWLFPGD